MKITSVLLLVGCLHVSAASLSQTIQLKAVNLPIAKVFSAIEEQTGYMVVYNSQVIKTAKLVTVDVKGMTLDDFLKIILKDQSLKYEINEKTILIAKRPDAITPQGAISLMMEKQQLTISGRVTGTGGIGLEGVTISVKNSTVASVSDHNGNYKIAVPNASSVLIFSIVGYTSQEVLAGSGPTLNVQLKESINEMDEVVVVGYGTQKKSDLTGSISSVKGSELQTNAATTLAQTLKGQVPGLSFSQTSSQPGAAVWMQIRGAAANASPLIVIDGVPVSTMWEPDAKLNFGKGDKEGVLDNINPDDVQDIQVLKDASATSIYGSRAAGGVILITTKRGAAGDKTDVSFKSSYTSQWIAQRPHVMSAKEYMQASNDGQLEHWVKDQGYYPWGTKELPSTDELKQLYLASGQKWNYDPASIASFTGGTDWYDAVTRTGTQPQYDLSIVGGNQKSSYLISLGRMDDNGIAKNNSYDRTTGRLNFDQTFSRFVKGGISASFAQTNSNDVAISGASGTTTLFQAARKYDPTIPIRDANGNYALGTIYGLAQNPASILDVTFQTKKDNLLTSGYLDITPIKELDVKGTVGFDRKFSNQGSYFPMTTQEGIYAGGIAKVNNNDLTNYYFNVTATFSKDFSGGHFLKFMAGWEYQKLASEGLDADNQDFPYDGATWHNLGLGTYARPDVGSFYGVTQNASLISRLNYSYKNKYLLTANFRRDGSSNFAKNKQWGDFGGVSVAWKLKEENFLKGLDWLSDLKLRAGAGLTGNAGSLTGTQTYYEAGRDYYFNNTYTSGVGLAVLGNPDLSWETQKDINLGLDFGLLESRFGGTIDVYERTIKNRIGIKNLMSYQEVNTLNYNTQRIDKTRGLDLSLYGTLVNNSKFSWRSQLTFTYYKDFTTKRDPSEILDINQPYKYNWGDVWSYKADGLVQPNEVVPYMPGAVAGVVKIKDLNGYLYDGSGNVVRDSDGRPKYSGTPDGKINNADLANLGNHTPMPFSWSNTFSFKGFDLNIYLYGKFNNFKNNDELANISYGPYEGMNAIEIYKQRFTFDNLTSTVPGFTQNTNSTLGYGDYLMENAWFIRLDNITLGYTLPKTVTKKFLQSVRFFAAMKNIATITPYKGQDPEYDIYLYPSSSAFTAGVNIKF